MYTVEPPYATTSHNYATVNPKHQNFPSQSLTVGVCSKRPPLVSDHYHFLGLMVNDSSLFLTSCKRPLDVFSDLYVRGVRYAT